MCLLKSCSVDKWKYTRWLCDSLYVKTNLWYDHPNLILHVVHWHPMCVKHCTPCTMLLLHLRGSSEGLEGRRRGSSLTSCLLRKVPLYPSSVQPPLWARTRATWLVTLSWHLSLDYREIRNSAVFALCLHITFKESIASVCNTSP